VGLIAVFNRTPAYAAPEMFVDPTKASFQVDIWSLAASIFHLVAKDLPFECSTPIIASVNITDMTSSAPDVRDKAPVDLRDQISPMLAGAIARGLQKDKGKRFQSTDEMCMALHRCLVQQNLGTYSVYILYDHRAQAGKTMSYDRICAAILYNALNNTETTQKNRVFACMRPLDLKPDNSWEGFAIGFKNSLIAIPIFSHTTIEHLESHKGSKDDKVDEFLMELILMQAVSNKNSNSGSEKFQFRKILPLILQVDSEHISAQTLVPRESFPSKMAAADFMKSSGATINMEDPKNFLSVQETVNAFLNLNETDFLRRISASISTKDETKNSGETFTDTKASDEVASPEEDSEIVERLRALNIQEEISDAIIISWKKKIQQIVQTIYEEIDQVSYVTQEGEGGGGETERDTHNLNVWSYQSVSMKYQVDVLKSMS
jgi:serine/threonine protein kinase